LKRCKKAVLRAVSRCFLPSGYQDVVTSEGE
jgi:hypothetical protein